MAPGEFTPAPSLDHPPLLFSQSPPPLHTHTHTTTSTTFVFLSAMSPTPPVRQHFGGTFPPVKASNTVVKVSRWSSPSRIGAGRGVTLTAMHALPRLKSTFPQIRSQVPPSSPHLDCALPPYLRGIFSRLHHWLPSRRSLSNLEFWCKVMHICDA